MWDGRQICLWLDHDKVLYLYNAAKNGKVIWILIYFWNIYKSEAQPKWSIYSLQELMNNISYCSFLEECL